MVQFRDEGVFDVPVDKIWKYLSDERPGVHEHRLIRNTKTIEAKGNVMVQEMDMLNADGKGTHKETWKTSMNPPKGFDMEAIAGPTKGTRYTHTYTPLGNKTKVEVVGEARVQDLDDASTKKALLGFLEEVFNEDNAALKKYQ